MTIHRHGNAMTMNRACGMQGCVPGRYNGNLEAFGRDFRNYFDNLPAEQRVWAVVLSSAIYEYFVATYQLLLVSIRSGISHHHHSTATNGNKCAP